MDAEMPRAGRPLGWIFQPAGLRQAEAFAYSNPFVACGTRLFGSGWGFLGLGSCGEGVDDFVGAGVVEALAGLVFDGAGIGF